METSAAPNDRNKKLIFKNFAPFTDCTNEINYRPGDNAKDIDVVMSMHKLMTLMQQCQCIFLYNIVIIIQKHLKLCGYIAETNQL